MQRRRARRSTPPGDVRAWLKGLVVALLVGACSVQYVIPAESCDDPLSLCDGQCVDVSSDPAHCGACDLSCGAGEECVASRCVAACEGDEVRCRVGCVDLQTSPLHCGGCDFSCPSGQVCIAGACDDPCDGACDPFTEVCEGGACVCRQGFSRCGEACVDTRISPAHCGGCELECALCRRGVCGEDCAGFPDQCVDACTDVAVDPSNCGSCGMRCAADSVCLRGQCVAAEPSGCSVCPCELCDALALDCVDPDPYGAPVCL